MQISVVIVFWFCFFLIMPAVYGMNVSFIYLCESQGKNSKLSKLHNFHVES